MAAYAPNFTAGAYKVTWNSQFLGYTEAGFEWIVRPSANIIRLDPTGRVPVDALLTGTEDIVIRLESMEWNQSDVTGDTGAIWPSAIPFLYQAGSAVGDEGTGIQAGKLLVYGASSLAKSLVLTPAITTDLGVSHPSYTFAKAYPLEPVRTVFSAQRLRSTPFGFFIFADSFDGATLVPRMYTAATS